jgi:hypothetical protein
VQVLGLTGTAGIEDAAHQPGHRCALSGFGEAAVSFLPQKIIKTDKKCFKKTSNSLLHLKFETFRVI